MSTVTYSRPASTFNLNDWDGFVTVNIASPTHYQYARGTNVTDIYGSSLTYLVSGGFYRGMSSGTLQEIQYSKDGVPYFDISGINADAAVYTNYVNSQNVTGGRSLLLGGNDTVLGSAGNDQLYAYTGNDTYFGGKGIDTVIYDGGKNSYQVSGDTNLAKVTATGKTDTLFSIERISFGDGSVLALDVKAGENAGSAYRAYQAAFDRKPDVVGLNYWISQMDNGASLSQVAQGFVNSREFKALNPNNDQNSIINSYYQHVLHRSADATGYQYWSKAMASGMQPNEVLASFSESNENISNTTDALSHGLWLM